MMESVVRTDHAVALCSKIIEYRQDDVYSDIALRVQKTTFKCHRLVLGAASNYFHVMFTGKFKESKASVVTLKEFSAETFEIVLQIIYTGDVSISPTTNLFELFNASEFFELPGLEEACVEHIREYSLSLVEYVLQLYSYFHKTSKEVAIKVLDETIFHRFEHFSQTPEFLKISVDDLSRILEHVKNYLPLKHDVFFNAITRWTKYAMVSHSREEKEACHGQLIKHINCSKLSLEYTKYMPQLHLEFGANVSNASNINNEIALSNAEESLPPPPSLLHIFAVNRYEDKVKSDVFSNYKQDLNGRGHKWIHSFRFNKQPLPYFMRTVEVNNYLYCLNYFRRVEESFQYEPPLIGCPLQNFITTTSLALFPRSYLTPPPLTLQNFDMCKIHGNIYVYNKDTPSEVDQTVKNSKNFDEEELLRAVYLYNTEVDTWLPVPPLKKKFKNACMTSDERMLYLIGGTSSNHYVQGYDPRTPGWIALKPTSGKYVKAACCVSQKKIYVSGGVLNNKKVETYDPTAAAWRTELDLYTQLIDHEMLVDEDGHCITYYKYLHSVNDITPNVFRIDHSWTSHIFDDLVEAAPSLDNTKITHMILFKPFGF